MREESLAVKRCRHARNCRTQVCHASYTRPILNLDHHSEEHELGGRVAGNKPGITCIDATRAPVLVPDVKTPLEAERSSIESRAVVNVTLLALLGVRYSVRVGKLAENRSKWESQAP